MNATADNEISSNKQWVTATDPDKTTLYINEVRAPDAEMNALNVSLQVNFLDNHLTLRSTNDNKTVQEHKWYQAFQCEQNNLDRWDDRAKTWARRHE